MALTREFKETIQIRAQRDPEFRKALLQEGTECLLAGDLDTGKAVLRDYINATTGFEALSEVFGNQAKPDAHVRTQGKPPGQQPVCRDQLLQERGGSALEVEAREVA